MTYKKTKKGFWFFKRFQYDLLLVDKDAYFKIYSKQELSGEDLDTIFLRATKLGLLSGKFKTEKGSIKFQSCDLYHWVKENESKASEEASQGSTQAR